MSENENSDVEPDVDEEELGEGVLITTAVIFGLGTLMGAMLPKIWRGVKNTSADVRDRICAQAEERRSKRELSAVKED